MSRIRLKEAGVLLDLGLPDGAFYLAGYSVECALKACIAKATRRGKFPDKKKVESSHTHNVLQRLKVAGLDGVFLEHIGRDPQFGRNWDRIQTWSEQSRYRRHQMESAKALLEAVRGRRHGIFPWIKQRW